MYARSADAYGTYRPSFYSPPGYTQYVYPNGVQYTPFMEIQHFSRPDSMMYAYPYGVSYPPQEAATRQVDKVLPQWQRMSDFSRQSEVNERPTPTKPVVQFSDTVSENMVSRPSAESRQDTTVKISAEMPETGSTELEAVGTVYHTAKRDNSSYREEPTTVSEQVERGKSSHHVSPDFSYKKEPSTKQDMEIKGEEGLPRDRPHDSVSERRYRKRETEIDAKAGATRHLSRHPDGMSARITDAADAKAGQAQHPLSSNNSIPMPNCRRIRISKQPQMKTPGRKPNTQKCRGDKTEWRRAKRQSRHNGKLPATTPVESDHITDNTLQDLTRQEMLEVIERTRQDYADLLEQEDDDPSMRALLAAHDELDQWFIEWENRFLYQIDANASHSEVSYVGEEIAYECGWRICRLRKKMVLRGTNGAVAIGTVDVPLRIGKQTFELHLFVSPHIAGYLVLGQDVLSRVKAKIHDGRLILTFNNGDVVDTPSEDPVRLSFDATYLYGKDELAEFEFADDTPETEMHNMEETSEIVKSHTSESGAAPSITTDLAYIQEQEDPHNCEGKTPEMSSVTRLVSPRRGDILEGKMVPYIPSSPVPELSTQATVADEPELENMSERETEKAVWTTGEVRFGDAESADGPTTPFPVLGVVAESTDESTKSADGPTTPFSVLGVVAESIDESTTPPPITIQLERNRPDLSQDWTDGKKTPAGAESM